MTSFQKLSFNFILIFSPYLCAGEVIIRWAEPISIRNESSGSQFFFEDLERANHRLERVFPDPQKLNTLLDFQRSWVKWAKKTNISISISNEAAHYFIKKNIWKIQGTGSDKETTPLFIDHLINPLTIKGVHYKQSDRGRVFLRDNRLMGSEDEYAGKYISNPFGLLNSRENYYDMHFFQHEWIPFWKKMEKFAIKEGYKSLDGYCIDIYSDWCKKNFNTPFYMNLSPQETHHYVKFFRRTFRREFHVGELYSQASGAYSPEWNKGAHKTKKYINVQSLSGPGQKTSEWTHEWDYINFSIRWLLIFEVWKNNDLGKEIRRGWVKDLVIAKENGWPYRVSFHFYGSVLEFIDASVKKYNGPNAKCFIGARLYGTAHAKCPQIFLHL